MSIKKIVTTISIITVMAIVLFVYPSINKPVSAEQSLYSGHEDHIITLTEGIELTKAFRLSSKSDAVLAHYYGKDALSKIISQDGCVGARIYYGIHEDGSPTIVTVGVDNKGEDITKGLIAQISPPCPPYCAKNSELKQDNTFATLK